MRALLASLPIVVLLACSSSGDAVDSDEPSVSEVEPEGVSDDGDGDASTPAEEPSPTEGDDDQGSGSEPEPDVPDVEVPVPVGGGGTSSEPEPEPEPTPGGGGANSPEPEPDVSMGGSSNGGAGGSATSDGGTGGAATGDGGTGGSATGGADPGECPRPLDSYAALGDECNLIDFDCENYFRDECGCGCDDVAQCRPDDAYLAPADECNIAAVSCPAGESYFEDACGCGCESNGGPACSEPAENYVLDDPGTCLVALFACEAGEETFYDDCGCGCRPATSSSCTPPSGNELSVPAARVGTYSCYGYPGSPRVIESADDLEEFFQGCGSAPEELPDFEMYTVFGAVVSQRPDVSLEYVVDDGEDVHVGVQAQAYCGGAYPPTTLMLIELPHTDADVVQDRCDDVGMCDPDVLPPSQLPAESRVEQ
jgi:hypothetical protein